MKDPTKALGKGAAVLVLLALVLVGFPITPALAVETTTFVVNTTGDAQDPVPGDGICGAAACTLRAAIEEANQLEGAQIIEFDIPLDGPHIIHLTSPLPEVSESLVVDASGEQQTNGAPGVELSGRNCALCEPVIPATDCINTSLCEPAVIDLRASDSKVLGLSITGFTNAYAVAIRRGAARSIIENNYLGVHLDGQSADANLGGAIIEASDVVVSGNVISGNTGDEPNTGDGIWLAATESTISNNFIGTDAFGTTALPNSADGIHGIGVADNNEIGPGNLISGNFGGGVYLAGDGNDVFRNKIGTDSSGAWDLGNYRDGIAVRGSMNTIGGSTSVDSDLFAAGNRGNLVSGNRDAGVTIYDFSESASTTGNVVSGNWIGTDVDGLLTLGNDLQGIWIYGIEPGNAENGEPVPGAVIGGTLPAEGNLIGDNGTGVSILYSSGALIRNNSIVGNYGSGIEIEASSSTAIADSHLVGNGGDGVAVDGMSHATIRNSTFRINEGLGIDLGIDGISPNDPGDGDMGANDGQNFPVLDRALTHVASSAASTAPKLVVEGRIESESDTTYKLEFFSNQECDPSGNGEGERFLGSRSVATNRSGNAGFLDELPVAVPVGHFITTTATDPDGNTSEFSACTEVGQGRALDVTINGSGTVHSLDADGQPNGVIDCPGKCSAILAENEQLTLRGTPASGWRLGGGSNCAGLTDNDDCVVTMDWDKTVDFIFRQFHTLTVVPMGDGSGIVEDLTPEGNPNSNIMCPDDCSMTFVHGVEVELRATTAEGSSFAGWSMDGQPIEGCERSFACTIVMDSSKTIEARFEPSESSEDDVITPPDTTPPDTTITEGPSGIVTETSATFDFAASEEGSTFACKLDGGEFAPCSSPTTYNALSLGKHTFFVRATDSARNTDPTPAERTWTVETSGSSGSGSSGSGSSGSGSSGSGSSGSGSSGSGSSGSGSSGSGSSGSSSPSPSPSATASPSPSPSPTPSQEVPDDEVQGTFVFQSTLSLRYREDPGVFVGRVRSDGERCTDDRTVKIFKKRAGADRVIGRTTTTREGRWRFRNKVANGTYYARVPRITRPNGSGELTCLGDRSRSIHLNAI